MPKKIAQINKGGQADRIYSVNGKSSTLGANGGGGGAKTGLYLVEGIASRGRHFENGMRKDKLHAKTKQRIEARKDGKANTITSVSKDSMVHILPKKSHTIRSSGSGSGIDDKHNWDQYFIPEATKKGYAVAKEGDSVDLSFPTSRTRRGRVGNKAKNLMTSNNLGAVVGGRIRKLTPTECEKLQGLPSGYTAGIADVNRYKTCGNAFNADVVAHILSFIPQKPLI